MRKLIVFLFFASISAIQAQENSSPAQDACSVEEGFKEPMKAKRLKKFISVDLDVDVEEITVLRATNGMGNGLWTVCVKGKKYKYRKTGTVFYRDGKDPMNLN